MSEIKRVTMVTSQQLKKYVIVFCVLAFVILAAATIFIACNKKDESKIDPYAHITSQSITKSCKTPTEFYQISAFTFPVDALVVRHSDCLGVEDMFMVIWVGKNDEKNRTAAKLLLLIYTGFQNDQNSDEKIISEFIKIDEVRSGENESHIAIYTLKTEKLTEPEPTGTQL